MSSFRMKNKYFAGILLLMCATILRAQDYGALQHTLQRRTANEKFEKGSFTDHLFLSAGIGPWGLFSSDGNGTGAKAGLFLGKWMTPVHGLRIGANIGYLPSGEARPKAKIFGGSLDYMLNISSLAYRYDYNRRFELLGITGLEGGGSNVDSWKLYGGVYLGMQGKWHVSPLLDLFIEPRIGWYSDRMSQVSSWRNFQAAGNLFAGFTYNMVPAEYRSSSRFESKSFFDHLFVSLSGGVNALKVSGMKETVKGAGPAFSLGIGKWFTPFSALRLTASAGYCDSPVRKDEGDFKHMDFRADYMFNLNHIFGGYDPDGSFNLIGIAGVNFATAKDRKESWNFAPGLGVGAQAAFRISQNLDMFVEPRINMYGNKYAGGIGWFKNDWTGELNLGLTTYLGNMGKKTNRPMESNHFFDNMFMTAGAGAQLLLTKNAIDHSGMVAPLLSLALGKWFTPVSGLRLSAAGGYFSSYTDARKRHAYLAAGVDYMFNIHAAASGYDPQRRFELIGILGANLAYINKSERNVYPGFTLGLQGLWHLTPSFGLFVEPQLRGYSDKFAPGSMKDFGFDGLLAVNTGVHYTFVPYQKAKYRERFNEHDRQMFVSMALGTSGVFTVNRDMFKRLGEAAQLSLGKWYTPLSAFRVNGTLVRSDAMPSADNRRLYYAGLGIDYMMSLGTLAKGYDPERFFDIVPYIGPSVGLSYKREKTDVVVGVDAGAQFKFGISPAVDLFLEPKVGIRSDKYDGQTNGRFDKVMALFGGISYKPQGLSRNVRSGKTEGFVPQNFVSLGVGTGLQRNSSSPKHLSVRSDVNIGRYLTSLSGVRLGMTYTDFKESISKSHIGLTSVHADYLLDLTTLLNGYSPDRRLTLSGIIGGNVNFSSATDAKTVVGADMGLQAKWKLSKHLDIYGEPMLNVYDGKADGPFHTKTSISCNMGVGAVYRF